MSQHDFNIANQGFPATRADFNNALAALATLSSGDAEPSTTYPYQLWKDTLNDVLKIRNSANDAWESFGESISAGGGYYKGDRGSVGVVGNKGDIFRINEKELNTNTTIDADENASAAGPLTVASGITLDVTTGGRLAIV